MNHSTRYLSSTPRPDAWGRLYCFPYAGGGATLFYPWVRLAPPGLQVLPLHLPGRENRHAELPFASMHALVEDLARELAPLLEPPFAFLGHSLGALVAFELIHRLPTPPAHFFVSASRAPHLPRRSSALYHLPDADFLAAVQQRYQALPTVVLADPELLRLFLPVLRADFTLFDTYTCSHAQPLSCPLTVLGGEQDREVTPEDLAGWERHSRSPVSVRLLPGGHFYLKEQAGTVVQIVAETLRS